uniref:Uncharacterized mitochondrial protein AtMg00810-like n=1 Tax=Tanacetum cinerariifolium TaxID=118510 RepID=A0A6L2JW82_TANCI|nr:uncharacterized mitochondrial protein AtMg00810-like [Tanacetum cinerariifolium]
MKPFGCLVTILNTLDPIDKFDRKADEGFFVGYSMNRKAFRVFNSRNRIVEETLHIIVLENKPNVAGSGPTWLFDINTLTKSMNYKPVVAENQSNGSAGEEEKKDVEDPGNEDNEVLRTEEPRVNQEKDLNVNSTNNINTVSPTANTAGIKDNAVDANIVYGCANDLNMLNLEEIDYSDKDEDVGAEADMTNLDTNIPVRPILTTRIHKDRPVEQIIGDIHSAPQTRRMTKNVTDHVARIEAIRLFLAYASLKDFVLYHMDVNSAFLYGKIEKEVYVCQPSGFEYPEFIDRLYKEMCIEFEKMMHKKFQMSFMRELTFLLGHFSTMKTACTPIYTSKPLMKDENAKDVDIHLYRTMIGSLMYLTSLRPDIMFVVYACARFQVTPKVSHLYVVTRIFRYLKCQPKLGLWYPKDSPFDLEAYTDSDYAGASLDRRSTTGGCQFLERRLISWKCKKQIVVANSTTKAEYVATSNCCGQEMRIRSPDRLLGFPSGFSLGMVPPNNLDERNSLFPHDSVLAVQNSLRPSDTTMCYLCTCEQYGNILSYGTCLNCNSRTGNSFTYDPILESFDQVQVIPNPPPQCHFNIYLCQICESNSHYGYECLQRVSRVYEPEPCYIQNFSDNDYSHDLPGVNPLINHHYCYKYGNSLNDFFCYECTCEFCGNGANVGYNFPAQVPSFQTLPSFPQQYPCCEDCEKQEEKKIKEEQAAKAQNSKIPAFCDDDDDYNFAITPNEPVDSLIMRDEHLNTIPAMESDKFIKSCVENLVPNPSESEGENGCDMPACFTTFSNILFDAEYEFNSSDDQSLSDEDFPEEIISTKIDPHHFDAESDLIASMLNHDSLIISSSSKIDSLLDEFAGELTLLKSIPPGIDKTDCHPENEIRLTKRLLYDNLSPRPPEEFFSENSNADIESFSPYPIPVEDSDSFMEEIDLPFTPDDPMPPGIEDDDDDSGRLDVNLLREALEITLVDQAHQFVSPPSGDAIMDFVNRLGYRGEIHFVLRMAVNNLYQPWRAILSMINQCLTGKTSGFDRPRYPALQMLPTKKGKKTKPNVIPYSRFTKLIIYYLGRHHNIHQWSGSPLNLAKDDLSLGNLKIDAAKEGGKKKTTPKANKPVKPAQAKQAKPAIAKQPKPKPVKEKTTKPDQHVPEPRPQGASEEYDLERAIQMSLESFQVQGQAHVGCVTIREPVVEAAHPLPVVEGNGKAIATEEQAAQSLLALHMPKRRNPETGAYTDKVTSEGDTKILNIGEEQGEDAEYQGYLEEQTAAGSDPEESHVVLDGPNPKPMHNDFVTTVYLKVHESLKFPAEEHVILEDQPSSSGTLSSMKNLNDTYTFGDQFFNDKSIEYEPKKQNVNAEVVSMVTILIHQASTSVPPLSTPIIDLSPPKPAASPLLTPFTAATTTLDNTTQNLGSRVFTLELRDLPHKINQTINAVVKEAVHIAFQAPLKDRFRELPEADMKEILYQRMFESGSYKTLSEHVALYEALEAYMDRANRDEFLAEKDKSKQPPGPQSSAWKASDTRDAHFSSSKQQSAPHLDQPVKDVPMSGDVNISYSEDTDTAHLSKIKTKPDWLKPLPEEDRPKTPEPDWIIPLTNLPEAENNWADALAKSYKDPKENKLLIQTKDIGSFIKWFCKRIGKKKLSKSNLEGSAFKVVKAFHENSISLQFQMEECHRLLTNQVDLVNLEGHRLVPDVSKPLPLGGPPGQTKLNLTEPRWDASDFLFKEDYTIISKSRVMIYRDRNDQKKMMRENEVHKFSDGTLIRVLHKLDHMVKDFMLYQYNPGIEYKICSEDDKTRSEEFMEVIERRLKIQRIF